MAEQSKGLSPPVRGNPKSIPPPNAAAGSIPARAGEPRGRASASPLDRVYPRPCGGTSNNAPYFGCYQGLSPPVRGNPYCLGAACRASGSIPARAGEPFQYLPFEHEQRVYPRPCGGTSCGAFPRSLSKGLSPPVRGNRRIPHHCFSNDGSIPARAGEPKHCACGTSSLEVYPRPCGGTHHDDSLSKIVWGLSPPVRGNHMQPEVRQPSPGSIPARAGEPTHNQVVPQHTGVYPRPCGGTGQDRTFRQRE